MFSGLHTHNTRFLTLTSSPNSFSLTSDACKNINTNVENDAWTITWLTISDSSHLHHFLTLSLSRQMSVQTFCKQMLKINITITANVHSFPCTCINFPTAFSHQVSEILETDSRELCYYTRLILINIIHWAYLFGSVIRFLSNMKANKAVVCCNFRSDIWL